MIRKPLHTALEVSDGYAAAINNPVKHATIAQNQTTKRWPRYASGTAVGIHTSQQGMGQLHRKDICGQIPAMSTGICPHDNGMPLGENTAMPQSELLRRIEGRLTELGISERKACMRANVGVDFVRDIRRRDHSPKVDKLSRLAKVLEVPAAYLSEAITEAPTTAGAPFAMTTILVRGAVQAGIWNEATEWPADEWSAVTVPSDLRYPGIDRFGLLVCGNSMDRLYPAGTVVIGVRFSDLAREPKPGERVVVMRRSRLTGEYEATLKEYEIDAQGRHILWPRSSDPEFQAPIVLNGPAPLADSTNKIPIMAAKSDPAGSAGDADIAIVALIVGSYRTE
jgi:transcriptional regulator with XRE-family HTH domain